MAEIDFTLRKVDQFAVLSYNIIANGILKTSGYQTSGYSGWLACDIFTDMVSRIEKDHSPQTIVVTYFNVIPNKF